MKRVLSLFGQLQDRDVDWMIAHGKKQRLQPGTAIIEEGKPLDAVYFVLDGTLGISMRALGNKVVAEVGCGEIVGEMSFIDARPPSATVRALTNALILSIARSDFAAQLNEDTAFAARFYRAVAIFLSDRLRERMSTQAAKGQERSNQEPGKDDRNMNLLENIHVAGARFQEVLRLLAS